MLQSMNFATIRDTVYSFAFPAIAASAINPSLATGVVPQYPEYELWSWLLSRPCDSDTRQSRSSEPLWPSPPGPPSLGKRPTRRQAIELGSGRDSGARAVPGRRRPGSARAANPLAIYRPMLGRCAREFGRRGLHIETKRLVSLFRCSAAS